MNSLCDSVGSTSGFWVLVALAVNSRLVVYYRKKWLCLVLWFGKISAEVCPDFVVILGMLHENCRNLLSERAFSYPFLLLIWKHRGDEWFRLL